MKKPEIAKIMARQSGGTEGEAADRLDRIVQEIRDGLRRGQRTRLPGLIQKLTYLSSFPRQVLT